MNLSPLAIIFLFSFSFIIAYGDQMGRLALELEDSTGSGTFTEVWFEHRDQGNNWEQFTVDLSSEDNTGQRQIRFVATETIAGFFSDMAVDEISIQGITIGSTQTIISYEDFEVGFTTWTNTSGDDNDCWFRDDLGTPTATTGPNTGADGTTFYVYFESSSSCSPNPAPKQAFLLGPTIDFDTINDIEITFWRHMWGGASGKSEPDLDFMVYKGIQYNNLGDFETAISIFEDVLKKDKNNLPALTFLGHSYFLNEKFSKAIQIYERVIDIDPNDSFVLYRLQLALLETTSYRYGYLDGTLEIKVHDSQGSLIAYLQTSEIKSLKHPISEKFVESWPTSKIIQRNNQEYSVHQNEFVEVLNKDTILGFHEIPFSDKIDLPLAATWHYQIPVEKGDIVTYVYSIFLPVN